MTAPRRSRSITLPTAPPATRPMPAATSALSLRQSQTSSAVTITTASAEKSAAFQGESRLKSPKLMPRFQVSTRLKNGATTR